MVPFLLGSIGDNNNINNVTKLYNILFVYEKILVLTFVLDKHKYRAVQKNIQKKEENEGESEVAEEKYTYDRDDDNFPSDLTVDHHPGRECQYFFEYEEASDNEVFEEDEWLIGDLFITKKNVGC